MEIFRNRETLQDYFKAHEIRSIGLVPTMGALHEGHISLVRKSLIDNQITVVSIFVNPTQFDKPEDLKKYPKTLERDIALLEKTAANIVVFHPSVEAIYNTKVIAEHFNFNGLENEMEGRHRIGHFDGVGTIVKRLFEIVKPVNAYFGEKDYQQLLIVKKLVENYKIAVNIVGCSILREANGLAMSSRNERLSNQIRKEAAIIYKILKDAKKKFGTESAHNVKEWVKMNFLKYPAFELEYFEIADAETLKTVKRKEENTKYRAFIAVYAEGVRLIDNIALN